MRDPLNRRSEGLQDRAVKFDKGNQSSVVGDIFHSKVSWRVNP